MIGSRRRLWLGLILLGFLITLLMSHTFVQKKWADIQPRFDRIAEGMTQEEVEEILGFPPGEYRSSPGFMLVGPGHIQKPAEEWTKSPYSLKVWYFDEGHVEVIFDRDGEVAGKYWQADNYNQPGLMDRLRTWLRL